MSALIYVGGRKGGTTKTTTAHQLCLGAILSKQPALYVLTDPHREPRGEGRPYGVLDGRDPGVLARIIENNRSVQNGWLIVDGGGNRPQFDVAMSDTADLTLLPFRNSQEDIDAVTRDMEAMRDALAWPSAWPTNKFAQDAAKPFIDELAQGFPGRVIPQPIYFVNSTHELLGKSLDSPSTPVRSTARRAFGIMTEMYDGRQAG